MFTPWQYSPISPILAVRTSQRAEAGASGGGRRGFSLELEWCRSFRLGRCNFHDSYQQLGPRLEQCGYPYSMVTTHDHLGWPLTVPASEHTSGRYLKGRQRGSVNVPGLAISLSREAPVGLVPQYGIAKQWRAPDPNTVYQSRYPPYTSFG